MIKKILSFIILIFFSINFSYAIECKYNYKWEKCIDANKNGGVNAIDAETDFLCRETNNIEEMIYNIILDEKFKIIDKEADEELELLEESKNLYFGIEKKASFLSGFDRIERKFGINSYYYEKYYNACNEILVEGVVCIEEKTGKGSYNKDLVEILNNSDCMKLAKTKLNVRRLVAYDIMLLNKQAVKRDEMKKYEQVQRTKYSSLFDLMMVNLGYWMRIAQKWPSKTKKVHK